VRPPGALPVYGRSRPKHAVSEGLLTLAEDKRPEANWPIVLRPHASQRHTNILLPMLAEYLLVADEISDAMPNSHIEGEAMNCEELLK